MLKEYVVFLNEQIPKLNSRSLITPSQISAIWPPARFGFSGYISPLMYKLIEYVYSDKYEHDFKEFVLEDGFIEICFADPSVVASISTNGQTTHAQINYGSSTAIIKLDEPIINSVFGEYLEARNKENKLFCDRLLKLMPDHEKATTRHPIHKLIGKQYETDPLNYKSFNLVDVIRRLDSNVTVDYDWFKILLTDDLLELNSGEFTPKQIHALNRYMFLNDVLLEETKHRFRYVIVAMNCGDVEAALVGLTKRELEYFEEIFQTNVTEL